MEDGVRWKSAPEGARRKRSGGPFSHRTDRRAIYVEETLSPGLKVSASLRSAQDRGPPDLVRPIFRIKFKWWEVFKTRASRYFFNKFVSNYIYQSKAVFTSFRIDKDMTLACRHIDI